MRKLFSAAALLTCAVATAAPSTFVPSVSEIRLESAGTQLGTFSQCSQIGNENEVVESMIAGKDGQTTITKTPGKLTAGDVVCQRPLSGDHTLWLWRADLRDGKPEGFKNARLRLIDPAGNDVLSWDMTHVWPSQLAFDGTNEVVVFTMDSLARHVFLTQPVITWNPQALTYGEALGSAQLNASSSAPGTFTYTPAAGTILTAGVQTLSATFTPSDPGQFASASVTAQVTVMPAILTVAADNKSKVYGAPNPALTYTISGFVNGESSSLVTGTPAVSTTVTTSTGVGSYPITVSGTLSAPNYTFSFVDGSMSVTPAPLTVKANNASRLYGAANPPLDGSVVGVVNGDGITATFSTTATPASNVGTYPITSTLSDPSSRLGNYDVTKIDGVLTITPAPLSAVAFNASKFYGSPNPALTGSLTGVVNNDAIMATFTTDATITSNAGAYQILVSLSDPNGRLPNYNVTLTPGVLTINKAPLTVGADDKTMVWGDPLPLLTAHFSGFVLNETAAVLTGSPSLTTSATSTSAPGPYVITISQGTLASPNYSFTFVPGTLTILGPQTLIANASGLANSLLTSSVQAGDRQKIEAIISRLDASSDSSRWIDTLHPTAADGQTVFDDAKDAVVKLTDLLASNKSSLDAATIQNALDLVVKACRVIALASIDDAVKANGDAKAIAKAKADLATGDAEAGAKRYANAVLAYRNSWKDLH